MAKAKKEETVEEVVVDEEVVEVSDATVVDVDSVVAEEAPAEEEEAAPIAGPATVDTLEHEGTGVVVEEDGAEVLVRPDVSRLYASRAVFDTSGTAGKADHDLFRTAAVWDKEIKQMDEVPDHLQKQLDSSQNLDSIMGDAYRP